MHYEYMRRLSEAYYAHWVYWTLMFLSNLTFIILNFEYNNQWYLIALQMVSLFCSFGLCLMMIITKRRTISNPRPDLLEG
jgi:general stress protein CsbA